METFGIVIALILITLTMTCMWLLQRYENHRSHQDWEYMGDLVVDLYDLMDKEFAELNRDAKSLKIRSQYSRRRELKDLKGEK